MTRKSVTAATTTNNDDVDAAALTDDNSVEAATLTDDNGVEAAAVLPLPLTPQPMSSWLLVWTAVLSSKKVSSSTSGTNAMSERGSSLRSR